MSTVARLLVVTTLFLHGIGMTGAFTVPATLRIRSGRFRLTRTVFREKRRELIISALTSLMLLRLIFVYSEHVTRTQLWAACLVYIVLSGVPTFFVALSFLHWPIGNPAAGSSTGIGRRIELLPGILFTVAALWAAFGYGTSLVSTASTLTVDDLRVAGLLIALVVILTKLVSIEGTPYLVRWLAILRKELALGRLSPVDAVKRIDTALTGMEAPEVLAGDIGGILGSIDRAQASCTTCDTAISEARTLVETKASPESLAKFASLRSTMDGAMDQVGNALADARRLLRRFDLKASWLTDWDGPPVEIETIRGRVSVAIRDCELVRDRLSAERIEVLAAILQQPPPRP